MWHRVAGALAGPLVLEVYTDGAAAERAGRPGAWAFALVRLGQVLQTSTGTAAVTTNLVMELEAAIHALEAVRARGWHQAHAVELISDSSITLEVARGGFVPKGHEALAARLRALTLETRAITRWVRAHAGHPFNELVDRLAAEARDAASGVRPS